MRALTFTVPSISDVISHHDSLSSNLNGILEEIIPVVDISKKLYEYSLSLFPYISQLDNNITMSNTELLLSIDLGKRKYSDKLVKITNGKEIKKIEL